MLPGRWPTKNRRLPKGIVVLGLLAIGTLLVLLFRTSCHCPLASCPVTIPTNVEDSSKIKLIAFVGVITGFVSAPYLSDPDNYINRRAAMRKTWFPADKATHEQLLAQGIMARFVLGQAVDQVQERQVTKEIEQYDDFMRLPSPESYGGLPFKVWTFLKTLMAMYNPLYVYKVDDDVYLRLDRVPPAVAQWKAQHVDYVGCMKQGEVFSDKSLRWFEPQHSLLAKHYFTHVWGSSYVVSGRAAGAITILPVGLLRFFANEDTTIGSWMLALNLTHKDDRRMCETECSATSLSVWDYPECAGLCNPASKMLALHSDPKCHLPAVDAATGTVAEIWNHFDFEPVPQLGR